MAAGQWSGIGDGGGLWAPPALDSLFPDEQPSPAASALGFFGGSLAQLPSPPPLCGTALLGYPQVPTTDLISAPVLISLLLSCLID